MSDQEFKRKAQEQALASSLRAVQLWLRHFSEAGETIGNSSIKDETLRVSAKDVYDNWERLSRSTRPGMQYLGSLLCRLSKYDTKTSTYINKTSKPTWHISIKDAYIPVEDILERKHKVEKKKTSPLIRQMNKVNKLEQELRKEKQRLKEMTDDND